MNIDKYGEIINGQDTYKKIAEKLNITEDFTIKKLGELINGVIEELLEV